MAGNIWGEMAQKQTFPGLYRSQVKRLLLAAVGCVASAIMTPLKAQQPKDPLVDCDRRVQEAPDSYEAYKCFLLTAQREGLWVEARKRLEGMLVQNKDNHWARLTLGHLAEMRGDPEAEALTRQAVEGFAAQDNLVGTTHARTALGVLLRNMGRVADAERELESALETAEKTGDELMLARVRIQFARHLNFTGEDLAHAYHLAKQVEEVAFPDGPHRLRVLCLAVLASNCKYTNRLQQAVEYYQRLIDLAHDAQQPYIEAPALLNLAELLWEWPELEGDEDTEKIVRDLADRAIKTAKAGGNPFIEASAHCFLARLSLGTEARHHYENCLAKNRSLGDPVEIGRALRGLASHILEKEPKRADALINEAIDLARRNGDRWDLALGLGTLAEMRWRTAPRDKAIAAAMAHLTAITDIRDTQEDAQAKVGFSANWSPEYYELASRLLGLPNGTPETNDLALAFEVVEQMRARVLLEQLDTAGVTERLMPKDPLAQERKSVLREIASVQRQLAEADPVEVERDKLLSTLERLELRERALRRKLARADPRFASIRQPEIASLVGVQQALGRDEAMLAFQIVRLRRWDVRPSARQDLCWTFAISRDAVSIHPIDNCRELQTIIHLFCGLLDRRDGSETRAASRLYRELLGDVLAGLPSTVKRLIIIPDGPLHNLPLAALRKTPEAPPLANEYEISIEPSATIWLRWRRDTRVRKAPAVLVLADPRLTSIQTESSVSRGSTSFTTAINRLGRLPHARREGRELMRQIGGRSSFRVGEEASEHYLKHADLAPYGILHLAAHAVIDGQHPERSAVLLAPGAEEEDGLLQVRDVIDMDLKDRVVVLAACRSTSGRFVLGEGVMGLARGFLQAGARAVVGSAWPIRDEEAAKLFPAFYQELAKGGSVSAALAAAQRGIIKEGAPVAAWAGVTVIGDGAIVPLAGKQRESESWRLLLDAFFVIGAASLLVTWVVIRRLRRLRHTND